MISINNSWYKFYKLSFRNKLDLLSKKIADNVFDNFIIKNKTDNRKFEYIIDKNKEPEITFYNIDKIIFLIEPYSFSMEVGGDYLVDNKEILINLKFNSEILSKNYEYFLQEVKYAIRHELEHAFYEKNNPLIEPTYSSIPSKFSTHLEYANVAREYLLDPSEIDSYIRELMLRAKNDRILIDKLLVEFVYNKIIEIAPETMKKEIEEVTQNGIIYKNIIDEILSKYRDRIFEIYKK